MRTRTKLTDGQRTYVGMNRMLLIKQVLPSLRRQGLLAHANFLCCQSCAGYELAQRATLKNKGGYVYWHRQDEDNVKWNGELFLAFGGAVNCKVPPPNAIETRAVGQKVAHALSDVGLEFEWDGTEHQRILVHLARPIRSSLITIDPRPKPVHPLDYYASLAPL